MENYTLLLIIITLLFVFGMFIDGCNEMYYPANELYDRQRRSALLPEVLPYSETIVNQLKEPFEEKLIRDTRFIPPEGGKEWVRCYDCDSEVQGVKEQGFDGVRNYAVAAPSYLLD